MKPKGMELKEMVQPFQIEINNFVKESLLKVIRKEDDFTYITNDEKDYWIKVGKIATKAIRLRN